MISNITISSVALPMPGYYYITVKATVTQPFGGTSLKPGYPKALLAGGNVLPPNPAQMQPDGATPNRYQAFFTASAGNYTATVTENWTFVAETGDTAVTSAATPVP